jgi:hypothetical protein
LPTTTVQAQLLKVRLMIQDTTAIRWQDDELLGWHNDGEKATVIVRPDACTRLFPNPTVAGTLQSIPSSCTALVKATRMMGADGLTPGGALRKVPMELLDSTVPDWHSRAAVANAQHFMHDPRLPRNYYLYPPVTGANQIELLCQAPPIPVPFISKTGTYSQTGTVVTLQLAAHGLAVGSWVMFQPSAGAGIVGFFPISSVLSTGAVTLVSPVSQTIAPGQACTVLGVISVDDMYAPALLDYTAFRAYAKDNDLVGNIDRATAHKALFDGYLVTRSASDGAMNATKDNVKG